MAQLQGFPACCGAQILTGLYPEVSGDFTNTTRIGTWPDTDDFQFFTVAITNQSQHENPAVVKKLRGSGFEEVLTFTGNGNTQLHLWARGRNWKPLAGAKGNMKAASAEDFEERVEKEVAKRVKKISLEVAKKLRIPRQPSGRGTRKRG